MTYRAALVLYRLPVAETAAAVILYHAIALWVPTIGGTIGFVTLRRSLSGRRPQRIEPPVAQEAEPPVVQEARAA